MPRAVGDPIMHIIEVHHCPRCGDNHHAMRVRKLSGTTALLVLAEEAKKAVIAVQNAESHPLKEFRIAWWTMCPKTEEPIFAPDTIKVTTAIQ